MHIEFTPAEEEILHVISASAEQLEVEAYLIGGFVRDCLINRPTKDMDVVCVGDGIRLAQIVSEKLGTRKPVIFRKFGTAMIRYHDIEIEFVGARKESYKEDSRKPEVTTGNLEDDLLRRDLTINAFAIDLSRENFGTLIDRFDGRHDLDNRIIRTPSDPDKTFSDDPLRMLRAIRFASELDFDISPETLVGIKKNNTRINIVSQERITIELNKIIQSPLPSVGFRLLMNTGLCKLVFPELARMKGVEKVNGRGHKDNFYHTLEVLDNVSMVSSDLWLRWAALLHDIAKPATKRFDQKAGWTFHGHEVVGERMVAQIFRRLKLPLDQHLRFVQKLVRLHLRPIVLSKDEITDSAIRRLIVDAGDDIEALMTLCKADITTKNADKKKRYQSNFDLVKKKMKEIEEKDNLRNWQPPITGEIIMKTFNLTPSRDVGRIKDAVREAILEGDIANNYDEAYNHMLKIGADMGFNPNT